jgi:hypothetical protein
MACGDSGHACTRCTPHFKTLLLLATGNPRLRPRRLPRMRGAASADLDPRISYSLRGRPKKVALYVRIVTASSSYII